MIALIWQIPLGFMAYVILVAFTWQLAIWITPIDKKAFETFVKHTGDAGSRFGLLLFCYPIVAPFQLMWAFRIRTDQWRKRKQELRERAEKLEDLEYEARRKELAAAEREVDKFLGGPTI